MRYGRLAADGSPQGEARPLPDDGAEHADLISAGAKLAIVWRSYDGRVTRLRAWLSRDDGRSFVLQELDSSSDDNDHPRLVRHGERLFALWHTTKGIHVHALLP